MIEAFLGLTSLLAIVAVFGLFTGTLVASLSARFLLSSSFLDQTPPGLRCRRVEQIALLPIAASLLAMLALILPALFKLAGLIDDHCLAHGLHHPHFCLRHLPAFDASPLALMVLVAGALSMVGLVRAVLPLYGQARLTNSIARIAPPDRHVIRTDSESPRAFLVGIQKPRIVLTKGLLRKLTPPERRAVVRHEIAHARAGDLARRLMLVLLASLHLPQTGRCLLRHWNQAAEERADDTVAAHGQGLDLASALVKILRGKRPESSVQAHSMGADSGDVARRIRRLADGPGELSSSCWLEWSLIAGLSLVTLAAASQHHAVETVIGWLG
ncbi:MAG: M56 family metallopeptidase [Gammaproteobacteria bacterium]|nr:M56 family metallopeptidase [Gammaproteobacteria bacterium]